MRNKEQTRNRIITVATSLFIDKGFIKVSTLEIAQKAGIAHGTIFFHFSSRSELIVACIYSEMSKLAYDLNEHSCQTDNVRKLCEVFLDQIDNYRGFYTRLIKDIPHLPVNVQRIVYSSLSGFSVHFVDTIEKAQKKKLVRQFEPKYAIFYWFGVINYMFMFSEMLGTKKLSEKDKKELITFFIEALKTKSI